MNIAPRLSRRAKSLRPSPIRKLVPLMRKPGVISLGGGYPNPATFAVSSLDLRFADGSETRIEGDAMVAACQYGPTDCDVALRPWLKQWHHMKDGVHLEDDQLQVLNGSQEGLHIAGFLLLERGDCVALSEPAYPGALGAFRAFADDFLTFPIDADGSDTAALERELAARANRGAPLPKLVYEVPNGHNPAGVALSLARRKHLIEIASRFDLILVEDDPYQLVRLDDRPSLPTLQSLDSDGRVLRLDSFSKIFAPGLRIGYASGPVDLIRLFSLYKQTTNLHTSSMVQALLAGYLRSRGPEGLLAQVRTSCSVYRRNRDAMVEAARSHLPDSVRFDVPSEGMFIWFRLPNGFDAERMIERDGLELGVLLVPGVAFSVDGGLRNCVRASFSLVDPDAIEEGMRRFGEMVRREGARLR